MRCHRPVPPAFRLSLATALVFALIPAAARAAKPKAPPRREPGQPGAAAAILAALRSSPQPMTAGQLWLRFARTGPKRTKQAANYALLRLERRKLVEREGTHPTWWSAV